jgi:hypothetical protein
MRNREAQLTRELRNSIGAAYAIAWIGVTSLLILGSHVGMIVHVALPWLALFLVLFFPRDFTLLKNLSTVPLGLTFGWLIMSPATFGSWA